MVARVLLARHPASVHFLIPGIFQVGCGLRAGLLFCEVSPQRGDTSATLSPGVGVLAGNLGWGPLPRWPPDVPALSAWRVEGASFTGWRGRRFQSWLLTFWVPQTLTCSSRCSLFPACLATGVIADLQGCRAHPKSKLGARKPSPGMSKAARGAGPAQYSVTSIPRPCPRADRVSSPGAGAPAYCTAGAPCRAGGGGDGEIGAQLQGASHLVLRKH